MKINLVQGALQLSNARMNKITVEKMKRQEHCGDWHDRPLRWIVQNADGQHQKFPTKKEASKFASIYRKSDSLLQAIHTFALIG